MTRPEGAMAPFDPLTADLHVLRNEWMRVREEKGRASGWTLAAFQRLNQASAMQGRALSGLRRFCEHEGERFFAFTIPGPDGHVYWDGPTSFRRNDGALRTPPRWWWEHVHGPIGTTTKRVKPTCGDSACINPEHSECKHFVVQRYTDSQMLGAIQVVAMRLGRPPREREWHEQGGRPFRQVFRDRFGSWPNAIRAAGLEYVEPLHHTPQSAIEALRELRKTLNRWPTSKEVAKYSDLLHKKQLPCSDTTIIRHLGSAGWEEALRRAGKKEAA